MSKNPARTMDCSIRKHLAASILDQRLRSIHGFYNSIAHAENRRHCFSHDEVNHQSINRKYNIDNIHYRPKGFTSRKRSINRRRVSPQNVDESFDEDRLKTSIATVVEELETSCEDDNTSDIRQEIKKRLSLPSEITIPDSFLEKHKNIILKQPDECYLNRSFRRNSLLEIGFGKMSSYSKSNVIGSGTYSKVYKGTSRLTNKFVALKEIHLERDEGVPFTAIREVSLLKQLKHINIITLHDIIYSKKTLVLVFEYVEQDLSSYMERCNHKMNSNNVRLFLFQLLRGLYYCHARNILHRDLKPQNILIGSKGELKLADFGLARAKSVPTKAFTDEVVTLWYRPPDVLLGNVDYGTSIDMWGIGCIFFEMAAGHTLFTGSNPPKQIQSIFEILGVPDDESWPNIEHDLRTSCIELERQTGQDLSSMAPELDAQGVDLLKCCLKCNPRSRISAKDAMWHKYFSTLPKEVYTLPDNKPIFVLKSICLIPELPPPEVENLVDSC